MAGFRERIETLARAMSFRHLLLFRPSHGGTRGVERLQLFVRDPFIVFRHHRSPRRPTAGLVGIDRAGIGFRLLLLSRSSQDEARARAA